MNPLFRLFLLSFLFLAGDAISQAQDAAPADPEAAPPGTTVITSDELRSDQVAHTSVFTGNVTVVGSNFSLTCHEMTVNFSKDGKVDTITATGDVVITQPGRVAHCGRAQYFRDEDKFVLTDSPSIVDNKNQFSAPRITIYRAQQSLTGDGGRTKLILPNSGVGSATAPAGTP